MRAAGEGCYLFANCTGGMLAVHAAARGLPVAKMALYEPPFESPPVSNDYMDRLRALLAEGPRADAVELFYRESVRFSEETISYFKQHPIWDAFLALAPTLVYDLALGIDYNPGSDRPAAVDRDPDTGDRWWRQPTVDIHRM
ncbi:hypothetical protein [Salinispora arenicola]|uniref:hypothetical protein n=1 Tax=Salinispora arenicola TaxID=168697 RepID=UPI0027DDA914|nr:hypothetical protein [Salinispora arenicola]